MHASLVELGRKYGTDKLDHGYLSHYERLFAPFRHESFTMLEIGVKDGASIRMWHEFFPAAHIVGLDRNPDPIGDELPRFTFVRGDQADLELLHNLVRTHRLRLVVEDGSHLWGHQIFAFQTLFPWLEPGGVYVCEDIQTSFGDWRDRYHGGAGESAADYFFRIAQALIPGEPAQFSSADPLLGFFAQRIGSMTFIPHCVAISAKDASEQDESIKVFGAIRNPRKRQERRDERRRQRGKTETSQVDSSQSVDASTDLD